MRQVTVIDEEILVVKQALSLYKEKLETEHQHINGFEIETANNILKKIKEELTKSTL